MLKALTEKRNILIEEMEGMLAKTKTETRAFDEKEAARFEVIKTEIKGIDSTIKAQEELRSLDKKTPPKEEPQIEQRALDAANFLKFIRGEERALGVADNGSIIPVTIANEIITKVHEISPLYKMVTVYNIKGDLKIPVYDEDTSDISADYIDDLTELTEGTGKFNTITLQNFIIGSLAKVSRSLMNRTDFDLLSFIIERIAYQFSRKIEHELVLGTEDKMTGLLSSTNVIETETALKITADDLINLQDQLVETYQNNACWHMTRQTRNTIKKLKDQYGEYLLNRDLTGSYGWMLLGKPVFLSENMPQIASAATPVCYCDPTGLVAKIAQDVQIQVLNEKFATQNATGVLAYFEADSKIANPQKIAVLKIKAGA